MPQVTSEIVGVVHVMLMHSLGCACTVACYTYLQQHDWLCNCDVMVPASGIEPDYPPYESGEMANTSLQAHFVFW
jgi:hypothetical protein